MLDEEVREIQETRSDLHFLQLPQDYVSQIQVYVIEEKDSKKLLETLDDKDQKKLIKKVKKV